MLMLHENRLIARCAFCHKRMLHPGYCAIQVDGQRCIQTIHLCFQCDTLVETLLPRPLAARVIGELPINDAAVSPWMDIVPRKTSREEEELRGEPAHIRFSCTFCHNDMPVTQQWPGTNEHTGQHYLNTKYLCTQCGYSLTMKAPRKLAVGVTVAAH